MMTVRELMRALAQYPYPDSPVVFNNEKGQRVPVAVSSDERGIVLYEPFNGYQQPHNVTPFGHRVERQR